MREPQADDEVSPSSVKIRQAFYEGMSRECLDQAWQRLDNYRQSKMEVRRFRGRVCERRGIPLFRLAERLHRNTGELSKWFAGHSPEWSNLLVAITGLSADWKTLEPMAEKKHRRTAGCMASLRMIRRTQFGLSGRESEPAHYVVTCLETLFSDETWEFDRLILSRRNASLSRISDVSDVPRRDLDSADKKWGDAYRVFARFYADSMDEEIWQ
jgi:hypothetical protein